MPHTWHYDLTDDHRYSQDLESLLVWLCAEKLQAEGSVQFASTDDLCDVPCWQCDKPIERTRQ